MMWLVMCTSAMDCVSVSSPSSYVGALMPNAMMLGGGPLGGN